ncbi:MAG: DUF4340 domain-containing protein [Clostridiales bacterium]
MRKFRSVIILFIVVLIFGGLAFYFTKFYTPKAEDVEEEDQTTPAETITVVEYGDKLNSFSFSSNDVKYEFVKSDDKWKISEPKDFKYDNTTIDTTVGYLSTLTADKLIGEDVKNLEDFGLDKPSMELTIKSDDKKQEVIQIGDETSSKSGYYLKLKDHGKVYVISTYVAESLKLSKSSLLVKDILPSKAEDIKLIALYKNGKLSFEANSKSDAWKIGKPIKADSDGSSLIAMAEAIPTIKVESYIDDKNIEECGLDNPSYELLCGTKDKETKVLFGIEKVKGTSIYAKLDGKDEIFTINMEVLNFLDKSALDVTSKLISIPDYKDVSEMNVTIDGKTHTSKITVNKDDKEKDKFIVDGVDIKKKEKDEGDSLFREYYQSAIGVVFSEVDLEEEPEGESDIEIVYNLKKDPGKIEISLISKNDKYYYAFKDGEYTGTLVSKEIVKNGLIEKTKELEKFIEKNK